jgi:hypothetical protein
VGSIPASRASNIKGLETSVSNPFPFLWPYTVTVP